MFEARSMLFIYVEAPLHAGAGRGLGAVDLPIQRERITGYPIIQASGLKGRLRAATDPKRNNTGLTQEEHWAIFGPETEKTPDYAAALSIGDARILLFPVRSLAGVFAWTTSPDVLARFQREAHIIGLNIDWPLPPELGRDTALVGGDTLIAGESVVLEEFSFKPDKNHASAIRRIGEWLAKHALPQGGEYRYWRDALPQKLCILHEDAFRDFVLYGTEVQTHIRLDPDTKTVQTGALWTTESLPVDTLLYAPLMATKSRAKGTNLSGKQILKRIEDLGLTRTQMGGDETTGQGMVALRFTDPVGEHPGGQTGSAAGGGR